MTAELTEKQLEILWNLLWEIADSGFGEKLKFSEEIQRLGMY